MLLRAHALGRCARSLCARWVTVATAAAIPTTDRQLLRRGLAATHTTPTPTPAAARPTTRPEGTNTTATPAATAAAVAKSIAPSSVAPVSPAAAAPPAVKKKQPRAKKKRHFCPPTPEHLSALLHRLTLPYEVPPSCVGASASASSLVALRRFARLTGEPSTRVLCLDVGDRYVGVAVSDMENRVARALTTVYRKEDVAPAFDPNAKANARVLSEHSHHLVRALKPKRVDLRTRHSGMVAPRAVDTVAAEIRDLLIAHRCVAMVVGMPVTMRGKMDGQCTKTMAFVRDLQRCFDQMEEDETAQTSRTKSKPATGGLPSGDRPAFLVPAIFWWDERLSSSEAKARLGAHGLTGRKLAVRTDSFAAATILQEFLDRMHLR